MIDQGLFTEWACTTFEPFDDADFQEAMRDLLATAEAATDLPKASRRVGWGELVTGLRLGRISSSCPDWLARWVPQRGGSDGCTVSTPLPRVCSIRTPSLSLQLWTPTLTPTPGNLDLAAFARCVRKLDVNASTESVQDLS